MCERLSMAMTEERRGGCLCIYHVKFLVAFSSTPLVDRNQLAVSREIGIEGCRSRPLFQDNVIPIGKPGGGPTQHKGIRRGGGGTTEKAAREKNAQIPPSVGGWGSEAGAGRTDSSRLKNKIKSPPPFFFSYNTARAGCSRNEAAIMLKKW